MDGVIINCDAMQSYDALPILTAQPSAEEQKQAPHRLYGHLHPVTHYSAAQWRADAIDEVTSAWNKGKTPIICGGTGFYLKALMQGLSPIPDIPETVRQETQDVYDMIGIAEFFARLQHHDPATAAKIDPHNPMRLMRAWEVYAHTGKGLTEWQNEPLQGAPKGWNFHVTALFPNRERLIEKINHRLQIMLAMDVVEEVKALQSLIKKGDVPAGALIIKAHGFRAFHRYLQGEWSLDKAVDYTQTETRQYAKRQMTWLRHQISIDDVIET